MSASKLNMIGGSQIKAVAVWLVYELGQRYQSHQNCAVFMNNPIKSTVAYFTIVVDEFDEILNHRIWFLVESNQKTGKVDSHSFPAWALKGTV